MTTDAAELTSGKYSTSGDKTVIYWQAPDKDGTGPVVWENRTDETGREVGRYKAKDKDGNEIHLYPPPDGFENRPSFDHVDNYVRVDHRGEVVRGPDGSAQSIKPGQALVIHADGTTETLDDEYARYTFVNAHQKVSSNVDDVDDVDDEDDEDEDDQGETPKTPAAKTAPAKATPATVAKPK